MTEQHFTARERAADRVLAWTTRLVFGGFIVFCLWLVIRVIIASTTREVVP